MTKLPGFLIVIPSRPQGPEGIRRQRVIVEIVNFRVGMCYYVGFHGIDEANNPYASMFDKPVTTSRFAITVFGDPIIVFASTSLLAPVVLPLSLIETVRFTKEFDVPGTTPVN